MGDRARLVLPAGRLAAAAARQFAAAQCEGWGLQALCEDVVLILSELVTNAVVHAESPAIVTMSLTRRRNLGQHRRGARTAHR